MYVCVYVHVCMYGPVGRLYTGMIKYGIKRGWNVCPYVRYACALFVCPSVRLSVCLRVSVWRGYQLLILAAMDSLCEHISIFRHDCSYREAYLYVCVWLPPGRNVLHGAIQCCIRHCHGKYLQDFESLWMFPKNSLDGVNSCVHGEHYIYVEY